jgi:RimJ/RimL family protein N-acetyltransferase
MRGPFVVSRSCSARYVESKSPPVPQRLLKLIPMPETARLTLRRPTMGDAEAFAAINADEQVVEFISTTGPLARGESDLILRKMIEHWDDHGFGWWMADVTDTGALAGFVGLAHPSLPAVAHEVEVGWRLGREHWGRGYATEGGAEAVRIAFEERHLDRLVCIIDRDNHRSLRVAEKLGFSFWRDMDHPRWPRGVQVHTLDAPA